MNPPICTWDQPVALRWLLADERLDEETGTVVGRCAGIDGLYGEVEPPVRERFGLLSCAPAGRLRSAVGAVGTDEAWLGGVHVLVVHLPGRSCADLAAGLPCACSAPLLDVEVVGVRPSGLGDGLVDVELEGVRHRYPGDLVPDVQPEASGFRLSGGDGDLGECGDLRRVYAPYVHPPAVPVTLVGCLPEPSLRAALDSAARLPGEPFSAAHRREVRLSVFAVDATGTAVRMAAGELIGSVTAWRDSPVGVGLYDINVVGDERSGWRPVPLELREIWDRWYAGPPTDRNEWVRYEPWLRWKWLSCVGSDPRRVTQPDRPAGATYRLDGRFVTDLAAFYCALGEAVNGPGGYFGHDPDSLDDCVRGGHGATAPFQLMWHDSAAAGAALGPGHERRGWQPAPAMDDLLAMLTGLRIDVQLR